MCRQFSDKIACDFRSKGAGWPVLIEDAVFSNVSTALCPTPGGECPNGPLWLEGRNEQCEGVTFKNVTLEDDRLRWPVSFMGSVANIRGELRVRNTAGCLPPHPYPNVSLAVLCKKAPAS